MPVRNAVIRHALVATQLCDMPGCDSFMTCPGWDTDIRHALVATQFYDKPGRTQFYGMPWSGRSFMIYMVRRQFYVIHGSEHNLTTYSGQSAVLRLFMVEMQLFDKHGRDAVL